MQWAKKWFIMSMHNIFTFLLFLIATCVNVLSYIICNTFIIKSDSWKQVIKLRNKSWKPEYVLSFNMGWWILVFYPELEASTIYFDSDMSKSTNTVVYFDWKTVIYIYVCGQCRTQFMLPNSSRFHDNSSTCT